MDFIRNFPFFSIMISMLCGIVSSALKGRPARHLTLAMVFTDIGLSAAVLAYTLKLGTSFTYMMGHFPAPWGNEIRAGVLEGLTAVFFSVIMLVSLWGGQRHLVEDIEESKMNMFYIICDFMMSSLLALIYTNDLFTAYVFVEINTIAACGMIMILQNGHGIVAAIRYMVMSQLGSGSFLIALSLLYGITGQLLMVPAKDAVAQVVSDGRYMIPLIVVIGLTSIGMAIKSGLYPFHAWIPDTYGYATPTASSILSSLVSKAYIFLLIKIYLRVFGLNVVVQSKITNILFVFGVLAMIMGSVHAIGEHDVNRMISYSSVAQIGYIYMGLGLGTTAGVVAAIFHMFSHSATKSMLFISSRGLSIVSDEKFSRHSYRGAGYRNPLAGIAFSVGALSMVGFPMLSGFISKYMFATAAVQSPNKMIIAILALSVSTVLNAMYFLRMVIALYSPSAQTYSPKSVNHKFHPRYIFACVLLIALNFALGLFSQPIVEMITSGLNMFV